MSTFPFALAKKNLPICLLAIVLTAGISCRPAPDPLLDMLDTQLANYKIDNLSRSMDLVASPTRFQMAEFEEKLAASLNRWAKSESELMDSVDWQLDPMADEMVQEFSELQPVQKIDELDFLNTDSYQLQQQFWLRKLGQRLIDNQDLGPFELYRLAAGEFESTGDDQTDPLARILHELHDGLSAEDANQLAVTLKLFDWVIRSIQLLPENDLVGDSDVEKWKLNDQEDLAAAGVPGLGYTRFAWQTMLFSRGDYVDRAKVFMTMIDQFGIDSVMLAPEFPTSGEGGERRPWAVAVHVGQQLFLFDTKMGLPIPGARTGSIATLSEAKANPEILDSLDLSVNESLKRQTEYWVSPEQLDNLDGLILVTPESLSRRFRKLEDSLTGEYALRLVRFPAKLVEKLPQIPGLQYRIWNIGFRTYQFRRALRDAIADSSFKDDVRDRIKWYFSEELYINEFTQYRTARSKYFNGLFETIRNDGNLNSFELFYKMMYEDSKIDSLATDKMFQLQLSLNQGKQQSSSDFENTILSVQQNMRLVRRDSGFFLAECHFDNSNFLTAISWLTRLEEIDDSTRWQPAINYLRARSHESQRDYESAIEIYQKQESEQFHGDLIRARQLKKLSAAS